MALPAPLSVSLEDKYTLERGRVYLTGIQALVRLPLMQRWLDQAARPQHRAASSPAIAARPWAASTRISGAPRSTSRRTTSSSSRA